MGIGVLILGHSGTGKSASMRNLDPNEVTVVNVANKPLPFKNTFKNVLGIDDYESIKRALNKVTTPVVVIDDAQYLMSNEFMRRAMERGFDKFTEIGQHFWDLVQKVRELPENTIVYFMAHIDQDQNGFEKVKTIGKLLDEKITVEGMFTIVLKTYVQDGVYGFTTQNSGHDTVKAPMGMFASMQIENDLKAVDNCIRTYYDLSSEYITNEEPKPVEVAEKPKSSRRSRKNKEVAEEKDAPLDINEPSPTEKELGIGKADQLETPKDDEPKMEDAPVRRRRRVVKEEPVEETADEPTTKKVAGDEADEAKTNKSDDTEKPRRRRKAREEEVTDQEYAEKVAAICSPDKYETYDQYNLMADAVYDYGEVNEMAMQGIMEQYTTSHQAFADNLEWNTLDVMPQNWNKVVEAINYSKSVQTKPKRTRKKVVEE